MVWILVLAMVLIAYLKYGMVLNASAQASMKVSAKNKLVTKKLGDATGTLYPYWIDMRDCDALLIQLMIAVRTGAITAFEIVASDAADGSTNKTSIKAHALGSAPDAAGDNVFLECTAEEVKYLGEAAGVKLRYVSAKVTCSNAADVTVVNYLVPDHCNRFPADQLTVDAVS